MPVIPPFDPAFARYCGIALAGQLLGFAGVWWSRKMERSFPWLSVLGLAACSAAASPMYLLTIGWTLALGWPFLLGIAALILFTQMIRLTLRA